jgi:hypothetical protein
MKVVHPGKPAAPVQMVAAASLPEPAPPEQPAQTPKPAVQTSPPAEPEPSPIVAAEIPKKPSPMPREIPSPQRSRAVTLAAEVQPPSHPLAFVHPAPVTPPVPTPLPVPPAIAPPPVSNQPEHLTPVIPEVSVAPIPPPHQVTLNAGLVLPVRLVEGLSSERNAPGDTFAATLDQEVVADGFVIAERGARVEGRVVAVDRARMRAAALALELTNLHTSDGQTVRIQTDGFFKHAEPGRIDTPTKIAGGAILGAAIGALAGGGKGAAIGAGVGGGAGAGAVLLTHRPAELASETLVTFKLKTSIPLTERVQ